jgi:uncharacterized membrane protein
MNKQLSPAMIALVAVLIALTTVLTTVVQLAIPGTQGYLNFSDVAVTFAGLVFGPWVGLAAGGAGTALADLLSGAFAIWAPISFLAHGAEGYLIGLLGRGRRTVPGMILAWAVGSLAMLTGYFAGGILIEGLPKTIAALPFNLLQVLVGGAVGIPLVLAVRKAYPPVDRLGRRQTWTE